MHPRVTNLFAVLDYALGAFFVLALFVLGVTFFTITGPIQPYELRELGGAYAHFLRNIEDGARALRVDYCSRRGADASDDPSCNVEKNDLSVAPEGAPPT